jgi:hypothetical protein
MKLGNTVCLNELAAEVRGCEKSSSSRACSVVGLVGEISGAIGSSSGDYVLVGMEFLIFDGRSTEGVGWERNSE